MRTVETIYLTTSFQNLPTLGLIIAILPSSFFKKTHPQRYIKDNSFVKFGTMDLEQ